MMALPPGCAGAHDAAFYTQTLRAILDADIPFDSVCFKDASGTAVPATVFETIVQARRLLPGDTQIHFHTHETAGISVTAYNAALDAGVDAIDLSLAPVSGGTCQPDVLVMWHALRGTEYDLGIDVDKVREAEEIFKECMKDYFMPPEAVAVEPMIPWSPMPGGALTANTQMLRDNGIMDRYPEMIRAMREVVTRGGFGTSVTPVSQFYFQQAFNNVIFGPWQKIAPDYGRMILGYFGRTPVPPDSELVKLAAKQLEMEPTTRPPLELNDEDSEKGIPRSRQRLAAAGLEVTDENIFIVATCGDKGITFLKGEAELGVRKLDSAPRSPSVAPTPLPAQVVAPSGHVQYVITVDGKTHTAVVDGDQVQIGVRTFVVGVGQAGAVAAPAERPIAVPATAAAAGVPVEANMPGKVLRIAAEPGTIVHDGDPVVILEAMKMEVPVPSPVTGEVSQILVSVGDQVATGTPLATVLPG